MRALAIAVLAGVLSGCASGGGYEPSGRVTNVDLKSNNYQVLKANAVGEDTGWSLLLCIIPLWKPQHAVAKAGLYAGLNVEGKATALANLTEDQGTLFLFLVCRSTLTLSADIIEFVQPPGAP